MSTEQTIQTFACTSWDDGKLVGHIALPFYQVRPPKTNTAWGITKCDRVMRINGTHPNVEETCEVCWADDE